MCLTECKTGPGMRVDAVDVEAKGGVRDGCVAKNVYSPNRATTFASALVSVLKYSVDIIRSCEERI